MNTIVFCFSLLLSGIVMGQSTLSSVPEFNIPKNLKDWKKERVALRHTLTGLMGKIPPRSAAQVTILSRADKGSYLLEKFEFDNGAGALVPGYMLIPKSGIAPFPAIYYCHCHGNRYESGKEEIFTTRPTPEVPAEVLSKAGYVVMVIDAYCFAERSGKGPGGPQEKGSDEELSSSKKELWLGRSLWAMMLRDDLMALDYLFTRSEVDKQRVAVTGMSMGATRSWWLMALDERIKTGVAVACLTRYQDLIHEHNLKAHGIYYFVPTILNYFDTEAIVSLIAPKPILFMTGDEDLGSPIEGINKIIAKVRPVYQLYGKSEALENSIYPKTGHVYTLDMWQKMLQWMNKFLR